MVSRSWRVSIPISLELQSIDHPIVEDTKSGSAVNGHANGTKIRAEEVDHGDSDEEDGNEGPPVTGDGEGGK